MPFVFTIDDTVNDVDLTPYKHLTTWHENTVYWDSVAGYDMYKLLAFLSKQLPQGTKVLDLGTYLGMSALALATNPGVIVYTYDIVDCIRKDVPSILNVPNIFPVIKNGIDDLHLQVDCPLIIMDVDPHDGKQERVIIQKLMDLNYAGMVLCDDIHISQDMKNFWNDVPLKKIDVTKYGHVTGTGIIVFDPATIDVVLQ